MERLREALFPARCWHRGRLMLHDGPIIARQDVCDPIPVKSADLDYSQQVITFAVHDYL
jgi:hypothetical protein